MMAHLIPVVQCVMPMQSRMSVYVCFISAMAVCLPFAIEVWILLRVNLLPLLMGMTGYIVKLSKDICNALHSIPNWTW